MLLLGIREHTLYLMKVLPYDRMGMSIRLMLGTGMRPQEIMALERMCPSASPAYFGSISKKR